ncbi:MAG: tRNA adenosine(34) deaminase TadA [Hahellaceae bacterium]|nr:tRNA adenosine(34) deaminase TadA [Hahellaceae bacterium]
MGVTDDERWMHLALQCAARAAEAGEVPVGAIVVRDGHVLASGFNCSISSHDPTAHAEVMALRSAAENVGNYRLPGSTLYVTLEPCVMCVGAIVHARVSRVVFGATEPKAGAVCSCARLFDNHTFNWQVDWQGGVLASECGQVVSDFFRERRASRRRERAALGAVRDRDSED